MDAAVVDVYFVFGIRAATLADVDVVVADDDLGIRRRIVEPERQVSQDFATRKQMFLSV